MDRGSRDRASILIETITDNGYNMYGLIRSMEEYHEQHRNRLKTLGLSKRIT